MSWTPPGSIPPAPRAPPLPRRRRGAINPRQIPQAPVFPIEVSQEIQDILNNMNSPGGVHHQLEQVVIVDDFNDEEIIDLERGQNIPSEEGEE
jgi:hypothetical protein